MSATLVGILGVVLGVLLSNIAVRILEYLRRRERMQDVATAIRAEIRSHRQRLLLFSSDAAEKIVNRIRNEDGYTPFVPSEGESFVLRAIVVEIHFLPTEVIDPVVYYYRQIEALGQFAEDLRSDRFADLEAARKAEMYSDYVAWAIMLFGSGASLNSRASARWARKLVSAAVVAADRDRE